MKLLGAALVLAILLLVTGQGQAHFKPGTEHNRRHAITVAFCGTIRPCALGNEAQQVAECESGPHIWPYATNGIYWGAFQFGPYARAVFGFAWNIWEQARAAHRYYVKAHWSPWECQP